MSRSVTRSRTFSIGRPCFSNSATYSLLYSVPICGGFDLPSVVTVVTYTLPPVTIGDDHPRPGISCDHSTFSVFDQRSASRVWAPTGFEFGPRNCGQSTSWPRTVCGAKNSAHTRPTRRKRMYRFITLRILSSSEQSVLAIALHPNSPGARRTFRFHANRCSHAPVRWLVSRNSSILLWSLLHKSLPTSWCGATFAADVKENVFIRAEDLRPRAFELGNSHGTRRHSPRKSGAPLHGEICRRGNEDL